MKKYLVIGLYSDGWFVMRDFDNQGDALVHSERLSNLATTAPGFRVVTHKNWKIYTELREAVEAL